MKIPKNINIYKTMGPGGIPNILLKTCIEKISYRLSAILQMVGQIYPTELQLNKANSSDTEAPFFDLNLSITNGIVSSKIYDKRDDFNFEIVNSPFLDGAVPRSPSYGVYISQLIRFAECVLMLTASTTETYL